MTRSERKRERPTNDKRNDRYQSSVNQSRNEQKLVHLLSPGKKNSPKSNCCQKAIAKQRRVPSSMLLLERSRSANLSITRHCCRLLLLEREKSRKGQWRAAKNVAFTESTAKQIDTSNTDGALYNFCAPRSPALQLQTKLLTAQIKCWTQCTDGFEPCVLETAVVKWSHVDSTW